MAFVEMLRRKRSEVIERASDPWSDRLVCLKGKVATDGVERISTQAIFDALEVPPRQRASAYRRLACAMRDLGWSPIRARGLNQGGYTDVVRGYARKTADNANKVQQTVRF